jgi:hypothetical protein
MSGVRVSLEAERHRLEEGHTMSVRHTGKHSIVVTPTYRVHRRVTVMLSAIVLSLVTIVALVANMVYLNQTGASLIPGLGM